MAVLRFGISKTKDQWELVDKVVVQKNIGKPIPPKGAGLTRFINWELTKLFNGDPAECPPDRLMRIRRDFKMNMNQSVIEQITCEANQMGITVSEYITLRIIDPHIIKP